MGIQFYAGWLTEYSLSIDNLFVFIILMAALRVPREYQQEALMVGIILALIFRGIFIALGYQLINNFSWVFYVFGAFLVYTAVTLVKSYRSHEDEHPEDNRIVRFAQSHLNVGEEYHGLKLWYRENGARVVSPMLIVIIALGTTDLLFALDSIPAIFGITQEPYLVFTANVFALMGLRQLYFLLGGLLERLVYLSLGLAFILAFIGVKLVLHALHENELPFINDGEPVHVPGHLVAVQPRRHHRDPGRHRRRQPGQGQEGRRGAGGRPRNRRRCRPGVVPGMSERRRPSPSSTWCRSAPTRPPATRSRRPCRWPGSPTSSATSATGWPSTTTCRRSRRPTRRC